MYRYAIKNILNVLLKCIIYVGSSLNGRCEADDHCGAIDSYCNNGTCVCKNRFAYHGDACVQRK